MVTPTTPQTRPITSSVTVAIQETRNAIEHPTGAQYQLQLSEGTYVLRDEIVLGTVPPHPSEPISLINNVLDNKPVPPTTGTHVSIAVLAPRSATSLIRPIHSSSTYNLSLPPSISENPQDSPHSGSEHEQSSFSPFRMGGFRVAKAAQSNGNKDVKDTLKRKKPKNSMTKSSSSFVSRTVQHDALNKRLNEHNPEGAFAIANINRAVHWLDLSSAAKADSLTKIMFTKTHALCHDINDFTKTITHLDIVLGFSTADIMWYEPMSQKYARLNKNGMINPSAVSQIKWFPSSENLFVAAHIDGTLVVYDKEKDDGPFTPEDALPVRLSNDGKRIPRLLVRKSIQSSSEKTNPVAVWKASNQCINGMEFSPDGSLLAVVSEDGTLRVYDYMKEQLRDQYSSYYGGLTCVCWSPDGAYLLTGGQDDLVSIWSAEDRALVARCVGHRSWVTAVAFDPWRCDDRTYRFGSVGEDCRLLLWDFSVGMLHRPRAASIRQSISSFVPPGGPERSQSMATITRFPSSLKSVHETADMDGERVAHPALPRSHVAMLPPVLSKEIDEHPLTFISFQHDAITTASTKGHIQTWDRPKEDAANSGLNLSNPFEKAH